MGRPKGSKNKKLKSIFRNCITCNKKFKVYPYRFKTASFCSVECMKIKKIKCKCIMCNKEFEIYPYRKKAFFCSNKCKGRYRFLGKGNPNWKGGITNPKYKKFITSQWIKNHRIEMNIKNHNRRIKIKNGGSFTKEEWELLKKQYNFICPNCGRSEPEIKLTIDHKISISKGGTNYIENIQPLCRNCNSKKYNKIINFKQNILCVPIAQ